MCPAETVNTYPITPPAQSVFSASNSKKGKDKSGKSKRKK